MIEPPYIRIAHTGDVDMLAALAARTFQDAFARDNAPDDIQAYIRESFSTERLCTELTIPAISSCLRTSPRQIGRTDTPS